MPSDHASSSASSESLDPRRLYLGTCKTCHRRLEPDDEEFGRGLCDECRPRPKVVWIDKDTGEIKLRAYTGREPVIWSRHAPSNPTGEPQFRGEFEEWEMTALEMALQLVPDLEVACDRGRMQGKNVQVTVQVVEPE